MEENTYKPKNIKFPLSLVLVIFLAVSILWYLFSSTNFLPTDQEGAYNWINILFFTILSTTTIGSFVTLIAYLIQEYILRKEEGISTYARSFKWGFLLSFGILVAIILNFFHILNIFWGLGIIVIVVILSFVI